MKMEMQVNLGRRRLSGRRAGSDTSSASGDGVSGPRRAILIVIGGKPLHASPYTGHLHQHLCVICLV